MDDRDWAEKRSELDQSRRFKHNSLLTALRAINRLCLDIIPKNTGVKLNCWELFSLNQLTDENRTIAGEWAYYTIFGERVKKHIAKIEQKLKTEE